METLGGKTFKKREWQITVPDVTRNMNRTETEWFCHEEVMEV